MKNLSPLQTDSSALYERIISVRHDANLRQRLTGLLPQMKNRFDLYEKNVLSLSSITPIVWDEQSKKDLQTFFKQKCEATDEVKATIKKKYPTKCPYCGLSEVDPLDHYLPISKFPEYSLFSVNLIPCCQVCNKNKGDKWLDADGNRVAINLYFDPVDVSQFLYCHIEYSEGIPIPVFSLDSASLSTDLAGVFVNHFTELKLFERYLNESNEVITSAMISIKRSGLTNPAMIAQSLASQATDLRIVYGKNHWKAAIYDGLSQSNAFLNSDFSV